MCICHCLDLFCASGGIQQGAFFYVLKEGGVDVGSCWDNNATPSCLGDLRWELTWFQRAGDGLG